MHTASQPRTSGRSSGPKLERSPQRRARSPCRNGATAWRTTPSQADGATAVSSDHTEMSGPDFARGVSLSLIPDGGMLAGHAEGKPVLLARERDDVFAVGGQCTH